MDNNDLADVSLMEHLARAWKESSMKDELKNQHEAALGRSETRGGEAVPETPTGVAIERPPHTKAHRVAVACVKCRLRKVKCDGDGEMPCGRCRRIYNEAGVCSYAPPPVPPNRTVPVVPDKRHVFNVI